MDGHHYTHCIVPGTGCNLATAALLMPLRNYHRMDTIRSIVHRFKAGEQIIKNYVELAPEPTERDAHNRNIFRKIKQCVFRVWCPWHFLFTGCNFGN